MPKAAAEKTSVPRLPAEIFSADYNPSLIHQALTSYLSNERQGSVLLKNRSAVRGGGKKPLGRKVQDELEQVQYEAQSGLVAPHLQMLKTMKRR